MNKSHSKQKALKENKASFDKLVLGIKKSLEDMKQSHDALGKIRF